MDFERKFEFFKIPKLSYTGPLGTTDPEYGVTAKKYGVSVRFRRKLGIFGKTVG
jgi:hypothetical protein